MSDNVYPCSHCNGTGELRKPGSGRYRIVQELQDGHESYGDFTYAEAQAELKRRQEKPGFAAEAWHYRIEEIRE